MLSAIRREWGMVWGFTVGWRPDDSVIRPSCTPAIQRRALWKTRLFGPLLQCLCLRASGQKPIDSSIPILFTFGRPSDVAGFIIAVVVDSVQAMLQRRP